MRAIVIGAGFAGLAAADALRRGGAEVVVLEARDRVGGRVWSRELGNGAVVELGAEFVLPGNDVLLGLVERFRLGLWEKGMRYGVREPRGAPGVDLEALRRAADAIGAALTGATRRSSVAELLAGVPLDPAVREAVTARVEISSANTADVVDASALGGLAAHADDVCPSVAGGNQRLALALAAALGDAVRLQAPVRRVAWSPAGVRAVTEAGEVEGDAAVVAVPASVLGEIAFEPALPEAAGEAFAAVVYGQAAKLFVPLRAPAPPSAVLSVPERYWTWTATGADGVQPVVSAFVGSPPALDRLRLDEGAEAWLASLARLRPDLELDTAGAVLSTWHDDPWVRAAYSTRSPCSPDDVLLTAPVGPLHFAGEHTAGEHAALMEGALRSGLRAAAQILARPG